MDLADRPQPWAVGAPGEPSGDLVDHVRSAAIEADDAAAARAVRARFAERGLEGVAPDAVVRPLLATGEILVAGARPVVMHVRPALGGGLLPAVGTVYVTSDRLLVVGDTVTGVGLDEIRDAAVATDRLLLILEGGGAVALEGAGPRLLRAQIAAARAARASSVRTAP